MVYWKGIYCSVVVQTDWCGKFICRVDFGLWILVRKHWMVFRDFYEINVIGFLMYLIFQVFMEARMPLNLWWHIMQAYLLLFKILLAHIHFFILLGNRTRIWSITIYIMNTYLYQSIILNCMVLHIQVFYMDMF